MNFLKAPLDLFKSWLDALENPTEKFIKVMQADDARPLTIQAFYYNTPFDVREKMHKESLLKAAIETNNPAIVNTVVKLVANGDFTSHIWVDTYAPIGLGWATKFDLLAYALHTRCDEAAVFLVTRAGVIPSQQHLNYARHAKKTDLEKIILRRIDVAGQEPS